MQNPGLYALIWVLVLIAVFAPISVKFCQRAASK